MTDKTVDTAMEYLGLAVLAAACFAGGYFVREVKAVNEDLRRSDAIVCEDSSAAPRGSHFDPSSPWQKSTKYFTGKSMF